MTIRGPNGTGSRCNDADHGRQQQVVLLGGGSVGEDPMTGAPMITRVFKITRRRPPPVLMKPVPPVAIDDLFA